MSLIGEQKLCMSCFKDMSSFDICSGCGWEDGTLPAEAFHLYPRMVLANRYIIGIVLGYGGFGITYKAWDSKLNTIVAIKEFYPAGNVNRIPGEKEIMVFSGEKREEFRYGMERFLAEARNMAKFSDYPHIVSVYDFFEENRTAYIVMEYLEGIPLKDYVIGNAGKLNWNDTIAICEPVMRALEEIHSKGILHRDISPDNIFITVNHEVKVIDFGAARLSKGEQEQTLSVIIKPGYAPPEQYRSKSRQGPWTDIYALGATMYWCITGVSPEESVDRVIEDHLYNPSDLGVEMPENAERAVMKAVALKEDLRFSSVEQFRLAVANQKKVDFPDIELKKRKKRRNIAILSSAFLVVAAIIAISLYKFVIAPDIVPEEISIWLPSSADDTDYDSAMRDIVSGYMAENDGYTVQLEFIPEDEYEERLMEAVNTGSLPTLFRSDVLSVDTSAFSANVTPLFDILDVEGYHLLDQYKNYFPDKKAVPTGYTVPVIYINLRLASEYGITTASDYNSLEDLLYEKDSLQYGLLVNPETLSYVLASFGGKVLDNGQYILDEKAEELFNLLSEKNVVKDDAFTQFAEGKALFYIGFSSELRQIQTALPGGQYSVAYLSKGVTGRFQNIWNVSGQATRNNKYCGMRFLSFLMNEYSQNKNFIQSEQGIPLEKNVHGLYMQINRDLAFGDDFYFKTSFIGQEQYLLYVND